jgi:NADPH:quinone reductase-like Zn-dependent oxidoreductase
MRGVSLTSFGKSPIAAELTPPTGGSGRALVRVDAAPINQLDLLIASGRFYGGAPDVPYVPGVEGVGTVVEADALEPGTRVWFAFDRFDNALGSMAELCSVEEARAMVIRHDIDDVTSAALGLTGVAAWMSLSQRGGIEPGEHVLVLGAGGAVGQIALQAARLLGAGRVIGASRSEEGRAIAQKLGADAAVDSSGDDVDVIGARIQDACDGQLSLVIDPVWGTIAAAAMRALGPTGRLVNFGGSGGPIAPLDSGVIRSKSLSVLGYTNVMLSFDEMCTAVTALHEHAAQGRIQVLVETVGLDDIAAAFKRAGDSPHRKLVVVPR